MKTKVLISIQSTVELIVDGEADEATMDAIGKYFWERGKNKEADVITCEVMPDVDSPYTHVTVDDARHNLGFTSFLADERQMAEELAAEQASYAKWMDDYRQAWNLYDLNNEYYDETPLGHDLEGD